MTENDNWVSVYTGTDFLASLLKVELENLEIETIIKSDKEAGLHSGFGADGFAQVLVAKNKVSEVLKLVKAFEEKMK